MSKNDKSDHLKRTPTSALEAAVAIIERHAKQTAKHSLFSSYQLEQVHSQSSRLERMIDMIWNTFTINNSDHEIQEIEGLNPEQELSEAISIVRSHYPLIEKLKNGNPAQQKLALATLEAVNRYNEIVKESQSTPNSWSARFAKRLKEKSPSPAPIVLPKMAVIQTESSKKVSDWVSKKAIICQPTKQEIDAFRMKAIKMIENHAISLSIQEALSSVREAPIHASIETQSTIVSFKQVMHPFPGETIEIEGAFQRNVHYSSISIPVPDSFHLSSKSVQTGFPYPSQYNGWALADVLIPSAPSRPFDMPLLMQLIEKKDAIALDLLPKGRLLERAKSLLAKKRSAFNENRNTLIPLHKRFCLALLNASNVDDGSIDFHSIDDFYDSLAKQSHPYDILSQSFQRISDGWIRQPYLALETAWIDFNHEGFHSDDPNVRKKTAERILKSSLHETTQNEFSDQIGKVIGAGAWPIILRGFSEKIGFPSPKLNDFQSKLQISALSQMLAFFSELQNSEIEAEKHDPVRSLIALLDQDILLFEKGVVSSKTAQDLFDEIQKYYS